MDSCLDSVLPVILSEIVMNVINDSGSSHFWAVAIWQVLYSVIYMELVFKFFVIGFTQTPQFIITLRSMSVLQYSVTRLFQGKPWVTSWDSISLSEKNEDSNNCIGLLVWYGIYVQH